jgi:hypothetical protein
LAALGDVFVNDAFATAHRAHASTEGLAHYLPSAAGLLMTLGSLLHNPRRPFVGSVFFCRARCHNWTGACGRRDDVGGVRRVGFICPRQLTK